MMPGPVPASTSAASPGAIAPGEDVCAAAGFTVRRGGARPFFGQDRWLFTGVEGTSQQTRDSRLVLDFRQVRNPLWRIVAKEFLFARLAPGHEAVRELPGAFRVPWAIPTAAARLRSLAGWLNWLTGHGVTSLRQVTQQHCDSYFGWHRHIRDKDGGPIRESGPGHRLDTAQAVQELASYTELFSTDAYAPGFRPWDRRSACSVSGKKSRGEPNKTQPLPAEVLRPLLAAALYIVEHLGPHVLQLQRQLTEERRRLEACAAEGRELTIPEAIERHVRDGIPFEVSADRVVRERLAGGWAPDDPLLRLSFRSLARETGQEVFAVGKRLPGLRPALEAAVAQVGTEKRWAREAALVPAADGTGEVPWMLPLTLVQAKNLIAGVRAACVVVIAGLTGMRASEIMEMPDHPRADPRQLGEGRVRYRLRSTLVKGQPLGGRHEEWVTIAEAFRAAEVAEGLADTERNPGFLFGWFDTTTLYQKFRSLVNGPRGQRLGLSPIPGNAKVNLMMLRRTLALELAHRPGGLLAAKVHLKHISVVTAEGYASRPGGTQALLLSEVAREETAHSRDITLKVFRDYQKGIMPAGPGAKDLTEFFAFVDGKASDPGAPNIKRSDQEVLNLLNMRAKALHLAVANYCWFLDPSKALCLKLAGKTEGKEPLAGMCDSGRCPQATHHPCHRPVWASSAETKKTFIGSIGRGQKTEKARLTADLARDERVLAAIDTAAGTGA